MLASTESTGQSLTQSRHIPQSPVVASFAHTAPASWLLRTMQLKVACTSCPPTELSLHGKGNLKGVVHRMMSSVSDHPSVTVPVLSRSHEMTLACIAHVHGVNTVEKSCGSSGQCGTIPHPGHAGWQRTGTA